jgi:hypothetical protein
MWTRFLFIFSGPISSIFATDSAYPDIKQLYKPSNFCGTSNGGRQVFATPEHITKVNKNFIDNPILYIIYKTYYERKQK